MKRTPEERAALSQAALARASNPSLANSLIVYEAAAARGLHDAEPGLNVLTFNAWKAKGRYVRKGEKALCKLPVFYVKQETESEAGRKIMTTAAVFHISQTEAAN